MKWFKCCHCSQRKEENQFYKDRSKLSGKKPRCKTCEKLYKDMDKRRIYETQYRLKNPEKRSKVLANYYALNKEAHLKVQAEYRKTERFKNLHKNHGVKRRLLFKSAFIENVNFFELFNESSKACFYCGLSLTYTQVEFDHFIPISKGGLHEKKNLRISCVTCNRKKGAKTGGSYQVV